MYDLFEVMKQHGEDIQKYSSSEVLTPQNIVSDMVDLLPDDVFNPKATFFDPAVKSGRFLKEIYNRLMKSPSEMLAYPVVKDRSNHILQDQLFGFATSSLAATMVRANLYNTAAIQGNIRVAGKNKLTKQMVQGAFNKMLFDVVIGNPPYTRGMDLDFVNLGFDMSSKYTCMITPAKWQSADDDQSSSSKISYGQFREKIVPHMSHVVFYPCCKDVFDILQVDGISYYLIDKEVHDGCTVENRSKFIKEFNSIENRTLTCGESLFNIGNEIIEGLGEYKAFRFLDRPRHKYNVITNSQVPGGGLSTVTTPRKTQFVGASIIAERGKYELSYVQSRIFSSDSLDECKYFISWLNCRFTRFFVAVNISKLGPILTDYCFRFVPAPPQDKNGLEYDDPNYQGWDHIYTDEELYNYYKLPQQYRDVIEAIVKERTKL